MSVSGRVVRKFAIAGSTDLVVLFSWSADTDELKRNVARINAHGDVIWRAELPHQSASDCYVSLARDDDGFFARTFRKWAVRLAVNGEIQEAICRSVTVD